MAKITIKSLGVDIPFGEGSSAQKYFKSGVQLALAAAELKDKADTTLDQVELGAVRSGFSVEQDVEVGNEDTEWTIEAGSSVGLQVFNDGDETVLAGGDFGEQSDLKVPPDGAYVAVDFEGTVGSGVGHEAGDVTFGFDAEAAISAANYRLFNQPASTTLKDALSEALSEFALPGDLADIQSLPFGAVATVGGSGSLKFSVKGDFSTSVTPLSIEVPKIGAPISFKAGGSLSIGAAAEFRGEFELRLHRLPGGEVQLGYYKKRESEFELTVSVKAEAGVSIGEADLTERLMKEITGDPEVDRDFMTKAGLSEQDIKQLEEVVAAGVDRSLEAELELGWSRLRSDEAAFLFTLNLASLDAVGMQAVSRALDGDLRELTSGDSLPRGIKLTRSVVRETLKNSRSIRINLFGIFNYASVFELIQKGEVVYDDRTGDLLFLDEAAAKRLRAHIKTTRAIPTERISKLVMERILISHANNAISRARSLDISHLYFEYRRRTKIREMKDYFDVAVALGLLDEQVAQSRTLEQGPGRSALRAETRYDSDESRSLFFHPNGRLRLRSRSEYVQAGRRALVALEAGDEVDGVRSILGESDELYAKLQEAGSPQAALMVLSNTAVNGTRIHPTLQNAVYSDYLTIEWWAKSMETLGTALKQVIDYEQGKDPEALKTDNAYLKLRKKLRKKSKEVAKRTKAKFGEPWGLVAMDQLGHPKIANVQVTTDADVYRYDRS